MKGTQAIHPPNAAKELTARIILNNKLFVEGSFDLGTVRHTRDRTRHGLEIAVQPGRRSALLSKRGHSAKISQLAGSFTDRNLVALLQEHGRDIGPTPVYHKMTVCHQQASLRTARGKSQFENDVIKPGFERSEEDSSRSDRGDPGLSRNSDGTGAPIRHRCGALSAWHAIDVQSPTRRCGLHSGRRDPQSYRAGPEQRRAFQMRTSK